MRKMLFRMSNEGVQVLLHSGRSFVGDGLLQSIGNPNSSRCSASIWARKTRSPRSI